YVGMDGVGKIDRSGTARKRLHLSFWREDVDLLWIQVYFEVLNELVGVPDFLLDFQKLAQPLEMPLVPVVADAPFLVFPMRCNALFGVAVHFFRTDLNLKWHSKLADNRGLQRLIA